MKSIRPLWGSCGCHLRAPHALPPIRPDLDESPQGHLPPRPPILGRHLQTSATDAHGDVHFTRGDKQSPVARVDLPSQIQGNDNRGGQVGLEKGFRVRARTQREQGGVERGDDGDEVEEDAEVGPPDAKGGLIRKLVLGEAVVVPGCTSAFGSDSSDRRQITIRGGSLDLR